MYLSTPIMFSIVFWVFLFRYLDKRVYIQHPVHTYFLYLCLRVDHLVVTDVHLDDPSEFSHVALPKMIAL